MVDLITSVGNGSLMRGWRTGWEVAGGWKGRFGGEMLGTLWILSMEIKRKLRSDEIEVGNIRSMRFLYVDSVVIAGYCR